MIRAGRDHDLLFAGAINHYQRDASGGMKIACRKPHVDSVPSQQIQQLVPVPIVSDASDKRDARTESGRGDGLVGPLATPRAQKFRTVNGIAGLREGFAANEVINIDASEDSDVEWRRPSGT